MVDNQQNGVIGNDITYRSGDADIKAYLAQPDPQGACDQNADMAVPRPGLIVIHEIWGLTEHIRDVARRFAGRGYAVLAPDLFTREGSPQIDPTDRASIMKFIGAIPDRRVVADLEAGVDYLQGPPVKTSRVGSIGFCMGGLYSYLLAVHSTQLAAAVDFYGRIVYAEKTANKPASPLDLVAQLKCPLLGNFGEADQGIPVADVEQLRERLQTVAQPSKINVYPGAGHAFFNDTRPAYHKEAADAAWRETLQFLQAHLS
ncbi:MAG: dienelactone hydrolase family protein [Abitibacteriaceae bacterium]|nr:dienelactone hydrolase family protein [Abditibacteriaceae bacterium]